MSLGKKTLKAVLAVLEGANDPTQFLIDEIRRELKPKKFVVASRQRRTEKAVTRKSKWAPIREKVFERASGHCEHCGLLTETLTPDHMFGGAERKTLESVFTVWALCFQCHREKTNENPSRAKWLERFIEHCARRQSECEEEGEFNGYAHAWDIAKRKLPPLQIQGRAE